VLLACSCSVGGDADQATATEGPAQGQTSEVATPSPELPGIEHFRRWSDRLGQGSQPEGDAAFAALAAEGFTTVLSVDGAIPDVARAARHGLRYVHVPIGYDGITRTEQLQIVKATAEADGPVFVHCHHGLHRGPAAASIARIALDGVTHDEAYQGLEQSGCSPKYSGLYKDVAAFAVPAASELAALEAPPEQVRPEGVRGSMVAVDESWSMLKHCKDAGWKTPPDHPDVQPSHEALMLQEQLREMARLEKAEQMGAEFLQLLADSERLASELSRILEDGGDAGAADTAYTTLKQSCSNCHTDYRD
jgi:protein tyrosine phosphatase (PTP) superfamily phosphohydrolase (DUF442 family)